MLDLHFDDVDEGHIKNLETHLKARARREHLQEPPIELMVKRLVFCEHVPLNQLYAEIYSSLKSIKDLLKSIYSTH